jgi:hypothetical protein
MSEKQNCKSLRVVESYSTKRDDVVQWLLAYTWTAVRGGCAVTRLSLLFVFVLQLCLIGEC